jgi:flagellar biosynthesis protein
MPKEYRNPLKMKRSGPNAKEKAVALKYDGENAPKVTATGSGATADQILAIAEEAGVPLYENSELVELLSHLELGDEIPEVLYRAIAEIIAFAYYLQGKVPETQETASSTSSQKE